MISLNSAFYHNVPKLFGAACHMYNLILLSAVEISSKEQADGLKASVCVCGGRANRTGGAGEHTARVWHTGEGKTLVDSLLLCGGILKNWLSLILNMGVAALVSGLGKPLMMSFTGRTWAPPTLVDPCKTKIIIIHFLSPRPPKSPPHSDCCWGGGGFQECDCTKPSANWGKQHNFISP